MCSTRNLELVRQAGADQSLVTELGNDPKASSNSWMTNLLPMT